MKIGLYNLEENLINIALMKISTYHKSKNDNVEWYSSLHKQYYDKIYASSIFTYSDKNEIWPDMVTGGSGFDLSIKLPIEIDNCELDYSLYPDFKQTIGFLTRGCIRKCPECIVPIKEGFLKPYRDIEEIIIPDRKEVILLDNNILGSEYGIRQIEKIGNMKLKVDFNQGLDSRLIDNSIAKLLSKVKWLNPIRLACDNINMIEPVRKAVELLRWHNVTPIRYSCYVLIKDVETAIERIKFLKGMNIDPFVQPYIDQYGTEPDKVLNDIARWTNHKAIFKTIPLEIYIKNRGHNVNAD